MDKRMERADFIFTSILCLGIAILGLFVAFWSFAYTSVDSLVCEECTFIRHEDVKRKSGKLCYIYVEEYEKPLEISGVTKSYANHDFFPAIHPGDTIRVCVAEEGRLSLFLCYISHNQNVILSHEGYLAGHSENDRIRVILGWIMFASSTAVLVYQIIVYRKHGKNVHIYSRFRPDRPTAKDIIQELKSIIRKLKTRC